MTGLQGHGSTAFRRDDRWRSARLPLAAAGLVLVERVLMEAGAHGICGLAGGAAAGAGRPRPLIGRPGRVGARPRRVAGRDGGRIRPGRAPAPFASRAAGARGAGRRPTHVAGHSGGGPAACSTYSSECAAHQSDPGGCLAPLCPKAECSFRRQRRQPASLTLTRSGLWTAPR
jgi:hypothetical protein